VSGPEKYGLLTTTVATREDAVKIADALLGKKLAACVQLMPIQSLYSWKGEIRNEAEILLLIKTRASLFEDAMQAIKAVHPYETPEIVVQDFVAGSAAYFSWIADVTQSPD
jgi:periplasmic divalent cation tolerance protein